jgi:lipopolysaccharide transport system ATP-binding protein
MSENAIVVDNLSKRYLIGHRFASGGHRRYTALRDIIGLEVRNFARKAADVVRGRQVVQGDQIEEFWALKDVSFKVKKGEVLGIIGRNGAGKSTLLKILSRITEPTKGRVVLSGRVASLLEVGTGFHSELTGSENVYLNGAILGMTQREIRKKFDAIVAFAEVEKFLDTPVKHYSSGMYVRLAFAVAAHLEPEILVVDEVLAVGDTEFQKKCLGKMDEFSRDQGRTVLFVSHNMEAILKLCTRVISFDHGRIRTMGDVKTVVPAYLHEQSASPKVIDLSNRVRPKGFTGKARLVRISPGDSPTGWLIPFGQELSLDVSIDAQATARKISVSISLHSARGFEVASWNNVCSNVVDLRVHPGTNTYRITFRHLKLLPGQYFLDVGVWSDRGEGDYITEAVNFEIVPSREAAEINAQNFGGALVASAEISILS